MGVFATKYRTIILAGGAALVVIGVALNSGGEPDVVAAGTTTTISEAVTTTTAAEDDSPNNPEVPQVACRAILTVDDVDVALNVWDRPEGPASTFGFSQGEVCREVIDGDENSYVRLEPGAPADFEPAAIFLGASGVPVADVGDDALWFGGTGANAHIGLLTVREDTSLGALHFRIELGRPELGDAGRLEVAIGLARAMLPRFPGVEIEPQVVEFTEEPAGDTDGSLTSLLYEGVESGEWTMAEGLLTILDSIANRTPGVIPADLFDRSATGVIAAASAYVADEPAEADAIRALLGRLAPTLAELEQMSAPAESLAFGLLVSLVPLAQPASSNPCDLWELASPCLEKVTLPEESGIDTEKFSLYVALNENSVWSIDDVEIAKKALVDSAITYDALSEMPTTVLVLSPTGPGDENLYVGYSPDKDCRVYVGEFLAGTPRRELEQIFAREIAFCLIAFDLFPQFFANPNPTKWLAYGLANYLSGFVYKSNNLEHKNLPGQLAQTELSTTVPERSWTNWILFEHFHAHIGPQGILAMIREFPESGDLVSAMAAAPEVAEMYHDLGRALSDANVSDLGPGTVPYSPQAWELPLTGPTVVPLPVPQFGVRRLHIKVPPGKYACTDAFTRGDLRISWREGAPGDPEPGSWSDELPFAFVGDMVLVVTSVQPGAKLTLDVTDVDDDPECQPDEEDPSADCKLNIICDPSGYYFRVVPSN